MYDVAFNPSNYGVKRYPLHAIMEGGGSADAENFNVTAADLALEDIPSKATYEGYRFDS